MLEPEELRQAMPLGDPGIGKTNALCKLAGELATPGAKAPAVPVAVILPPREWKADAQG